jgi:hypothetical protein
MKLSTFEAIVKALGDAQVRFIVVGGVAVAAHRYGRLTHHLDLVIRLEPEEPREPNALGAFHLARCIPPGSVLFHLAPPTP